MKIFLLSCFSQKLKKSKTRSWAKLRTEIAASSGMLVNLLLPFMQFKHQAHMLLQWSYSPNFQWNCVWNSLLLLKTWSYGSASFFQVGNVWSYRCCQSDNNQLVPILIYNACWPHASDLCCACSLVLQSK